MGLLKKNPPKINNKSEIYFPEEENPNSVFLFMLFQDILHLRYFLSISTYLK